jgi:hypothetical protein
MLYLDSRGWLAVPAERDLKINSYSGWLDRTSRLAAIWCGMKEGRLNQRTDPNVPSILFATLYAIVFSRFTQFLLYVTFFY